MNASAAQNPLCGTRLVAFDVDGVFTDGRIHVSNDGVESKTFCTQDGYGIRRLIDAEIEVAVISGRRSAAVDQRMAELGVSHIIQGCRDKIAAFDELTAALGIRDSSCVYVGDDLPDLPLLNKVGYSVAVANAVTAVRDQCDYTTQAAGGYGAVREVCDLVLASRSGSEE